MKTLHELLYKVPNLIEVYLNTPAGIGEHPDVVGAMDEMIEKMAGVRDKIETLRSEWDFDEDE